MQTEGCRFESGSVKSFFFFLSIKMKFYDLMPIVLQSYIRNLLSASYFNFDLFHVSPRLVIFVQYLLFTSSNIGPFILEKQKDC